MSEILTRLSKLSEQSYCTFIRQMQKTTCLGSEYKMKTGEFTDENLSAFCDAYTQYGRHLGYIDAIKHVRLTAEVLDAKETTKG